MLERLKTKAKTTIKRVLCHRVLYTGLCITYIFAGLHISDLIVYGSASLLYLALAVRG